LEFLLCRDIILIHGIVIIKGNTINWYEIIVTVNINKYKLNIT